MVQGNPREASPVDTEGAATADSRPVESPSQGPKAIYTVGTLVYTRKTLAVLFLWLLWGDFCYMLMEGVIPSIMPLKFEHLGATNTSIGIILNTIPNAVGLVLNPIISVRSDRCRSRWGRRIPYIFFTVPPLVVCLIALAFGERLGLLVRGLLPSAATHALSQTQTSLLVIGVIMVLFSVFNTFVNSTFWYLFNDVVPEAFLARFMSWFRVVSMGAVALYNLLLFGYAGTHGTAIMVGITMLYFVGFSLLCLNVKEGSYPPIAAAPFDRGGRLAPVKRFVVECHSLSHYWYAFGIAIGLGAVAASQTFMLFFYQSSGLTLAGVGTITGVGNIAMGVAIMLSGWLADRYHPIRIVVVGIMLQLALATPATLIWLFWQPSANVSFYLWMIITITLVSPAGALMGILDPPLFMRIFPRNSYGQFCSANALWRSLSVIVSGALVGVLLDAIKNHYGADVAYRCLPLWQMGAYAFMLVCALKLCRSWAFYGGDTSYVPPVVESFGTAKDLAPPPAVLPPAMV